MTKEELDALQITERDLVCVELKEKPLFQAKKMAGSFVCFYTKECLVSISKIDKEYYRKNAWYFFSLSAVKSIDILHKDFWGEADD